MDDMTDLYMNTPIGYPFAQKILKTDIGGLKGFLINTTPDQDLQQMIRDMTDEEIWQTCLDNNFTFDEQYFGARLFDWQKV
jgi:hypothetical protein